MTRKNISPEDINLDSAEFYTDAPMNDRTGAVLCVPYDESDIIYIDTARIIISPKSAVRRIELGPDSELTREFTKFVYDDKTSRESCLSHCDEDTRTLIESFRKNVILKLQEEKQRRLN